jgi:hypothetical protein
MTDLTSIERRLAATAVALDRDAPSFDPTALTPRPRVRPRFVGVALVALALGVIAAPAVARLVGLVDGVDVHTVPELGPPPPNRTPPFRGIPAPLGDAAIIGALGQPDEVFHRNDIAGDVATLIYGRVVLAQWPVADVKARIEIEDAKGRAEEVAVGRTRGVWIDGASRGTYTFVGADGELHKEAFAVTDGILLWQVGDTALRLEGAASREEAVRLAESVRRPAASR